MFVSGRKMNRFRRAVFFTLELRRRYNDLEIIHFSFWTRPCLRVGLRPLRISSVHVVSFFLRCFPVMKHSHRSDCRLGLDSGRTIGAGSTVLFPILNTCISGCYVLARTVLVGFFCVFVVLYLVTALFRNCERSQQWCISSEPYI